MFFEPFRDDELDVADKYTRFTNVVNVYMGICVEEQWPLGSNTDAMALTILLVVNSANIYVILKSFDPYDLFKQVLQMYASFKGFRKKFKKNVELGIEIRSMKLFLSIAKNDVNEARNVMTYSAIDYNFVLTSERFDKIQM